MNTYNQQSDDAPFSTDDTRRQQRPTPVRRASAPPNPRWRTSTPSELSTGWRGVYAALGVTA